VTKASGLSVAPSMVHNAKISMVIGVITPYGVPCMAEHLTFCEAMSHPLLPYQSSSAPR
jgi:hypothetical protein